MEVRAEGMAEAEGDDALLGPPVLAEEAALPKRVEVTGGWMAGPVSF